MTLTTTEGRDMEEPAASGLEEDMINRVARILEPQAWRALGLCDTVAYGHRRTSSLRKAHAVIKVMRNPTEAMLAAGRGLGVSEALITGNEYRAMIDAALQATNGSGSP